MPVNRFRCILLMASMILILGIFNACGSSENTGDDVMCEIGIVSEGNVYKATIDLQESCWSELTEDEKENVVDQCLDTVDLAGGGEAFQVIGTDRETKELLFTYSGDTQETVYCETL